MSVPPAQRLNIGCGTDVRPGWTNVDMAALAGIDVVHDLNDLPWPFADGAAHEIDCRDVLEHVEQLVPAMRELHRVLADGGRLHIQSPHFTSCTAYADPTHLRTFSIETFDFFVRGSRYAHRSYYFDFAFSTTAVRRIGFRHSRYLPWNRVLERLVNRSHRAQMFYEETALARLFPALHIEVELVK